MTLEQIISMAREACLEEEHDGVFCVSGDGINRFAALVATLAAAHEREECAQFCEKNQVWVGRGTRGFSDFYLALDGSEGVHQGIDYAKAIRARGQA
jgi:hypothetical protein